MNFVKSTDHLWELSIVFELQLKQFLRTPAPECFLPPKPGPCDEEKTRFFFNAFLGRCEAFTYGGCQGNANRFRTREKCVESDCGTPLPGTTPERHCQVQLLNATTRYIS